VVADREKQLIQRLGNSDWLVRWAAYQALWLLGEGRLAKKLAHFAAEDDVRAILLLTPWLSHDDPGARQTSGKALESISRRGLAPLSGQLLCRSDLTRFQRQTLQTTDGTLHLIACRVCGKLDQAMLNVEQVVVVLDAQMNGEVVFADGVARVNWLKRNALFDFDRVEIVEATDYDVERFCIQVGNDTDAFRRARYRKMRCVVAPQCQLSDNTLRILRSMFGKVLVGN
jgi:hypothetical protein